MSPDRRQSRRVLSAEGLLIVLSTLAFVWSGTVLAQVDRTGSGGGPLSTQTAPNTTASGTTMPPSGDASHVSEGVPDRPTAEQRKVDQIERTICDGCGNK